ncbi:hypothetical protein BDQ12DRAFT_662574 [Crucibulum laeve]|uniref:Uncharacterized protein n=1 Tax=Crucibulum laeve TaxID=68775 RepID=A0A5C3MA48_9AGAR|nr:hypothetical protein BDQ12DRAFT_662574 [Crucibulum laeve]
MRTTIALLPFTFALLAAASPLGNHENFRRHTGVPHLSRRFILQSRVDAPPACVAAASANVTAPDLSGIAAPLANTTSTDNTTVADNSTVVDPSITADNSTLPADNSTLPADNSTLADNSTSTDNSTTTRRSLSARIEQFDLPDMALKWQDLCLQSGGDIITNDPCVFLAGLGGINALLADADTCAQQDIADAMITFAKSKGVTNSKALIAQAIAFRKHPRSAVDILGVVPGTLYCQKAPVNPELSGVVNAQLDGVTPGLYGSPSIPIVPFGSDGTCPFGTIADVSSCSCVDSSAAVGAANSTAANSTDTSTDASTDSTDTSTADAADSTDATATDASDATATDASDATATDASDATATDTTDATATDSAAASDATDATDSSTDSTDTSTDSVTPPAATEAAAATTTAKSSGPNFQPSDIDGDVNDTEG